MPASLPQVPVLSARPKVLAQVVIASSRTPVLRLRLQLHDQLHDRDTTRSIGVVPCFSFILGRISGTDF